MFENFVCRKIFDFKKTKVSEQFRRVYNEKFCDLYRSANIIKIS